ncbi:GNAT family N-acetyltransferase [Natronomonas salina]|uniref:GNAT family N-acetyltransferase n=1 Tax=Natronomonas salina TaxID=1710540 RepID=UPI0015B465E8|nr:GNAT family N-acetyltransferase [Natronomonas salina]QLD90124.1 GNAT family N-acetyltransferase [Natronomonas salina]
MELTTDEKSDGETFRDIAGRSMRASYSLSPDQIENVVHTAFGDEAVADRAENDDEVVVTAEEDGEMVGFATGTVTDTDDGEIDWLFVAPEARGQEIGTQLFEEVQAELEARGAETVRALVLSENEEGEMFFEQFGLEQTGSREQAIGDQDFATHVYGPHGDETDEELHKPDTVTTEDGDTVYTGDEELSGKQAPFLVLYEDDDRTEQYGFFCTNCGTMANAADGLDRVDCDTCGNESRAEEWDGGYL